MENKNIEYDKSLMANAITTTPDNSIGDTTLEHMPEPIREPKCVRVEVRHWRDCE